MQEELKKLLKKAYAPYSNVQVAAILISHDQKKFYGVNVENAAYPSGICAERNAIFNAITNGQNMNDMKEIHIMATTVDFLFPCGACLQVMAEFFNNDTKIIIYNHDQKLIYEFQKLLPFAVRKENFK